MNDNVPPDLSELEYARHILEEVLGWPCKGNLEMVGDCILALSKAKRLSLVQAYKYILRAIVLAKEQGVKVDRFWLQGGEYVNVRPKAKVVYEERPAPSWLLELGERERKRMQDLVKAKAMK